MFSSLKMKNPKQGLFRNLESGYPDDYCKSPGVETSRIKPNEKDLLIRCNICGFICDKDRDLSLKDGSFAGIGVKYTGATAGTCISDAMVPAAGTVSRKADTYYTRDVKGGCPSCGSFLFGGGK